MRTETTKDNFKEISRTMGKACVCFNLRKASRLLSQVYDQALKPSGIKVTQFSLMMAVAGNDGITMGKLARPLGMDRTTLSRNARLLEKKGLIEIGEGEDRREQVLNLTEKGAGLLLEAIPIWERVQKQLTEKLGEKRLDELLGDLREVVRESKR
ncbi:DNA-binding transcriptional regulator, MarR family [Desulfotomaculum arcticum]|uniref:DNA-binding transcriptional regulator, MarR family n=1 Tax=Desulfotruncus arcticus DSM 17038 TaxID=1121424 RepID=A0A1I2P033_9FIRM|nr:MarR family winged helix-turn-helix transcriptional regulator [Desulfotruncus arcticus]SFG07217.1 DNA-binding transcriptional regulator, MarR family [Desulfotomaculum arcticum] [Desulfotruncus arcticus DSM 17038]